MTLNDSHGCSGDPRLEQECMRQRYVSIGVIFAGVIGFFLLFGFALIGINYLRNYFETRKLKKQKNGTRGDVDNATPSNGDLEMGDILPAASTTTDNGNDNGTHLQQDPWSNFRVITIEDSEPAEDGTEANPAGSTSNTGAAGQSWQFEARAASSSRSAVPDYVITASSNALAAEGPTPLENK
ncbi:hypothetical protein TWF696_007355 [Orbilia brochopaga]|uniref:Uncharacterized protein n=1 Tax=Orbilia brochopaga TaxID=3140254 RepID=A0AAV9UVY9_9PEZI